MGVSLSPASSTPSNAPALAGAAALNAARLDGLTRSNRDMTRTDAPTTTPSTTPPKPAAPPPLPKIAGLSATQVKNAWAIVQEGHKMGINARGQQIAIATAMQESNLFNLKHAVDHDSLGLFQQRPSSGWGSPKQLTNPRYAAHAFYAVLVQHKNTWGTLWRAAQIVQRSAFPYAYQKHATAAAKVVKVLDTRF